MLISFLAVIIFIESRFRSLHLKCAWSYPFFAIFFFMGRENLNLFAITSSFVLLYGIPAASLIYSRKENNYSRAFIGGILYVAANIIFFTTSRFLS
ncbi:hypothetical protein HYS31_03885 [Candidatus Woesearchaeota archaeon]|nr:hypothetical protein [Candidatus Woesearchaeota archaeon]